MLAMMLPIKRSRASGGIKRHQAEQVAGLRVVVISNAVVVPIYYARQSSHCAANAAIRGEWSAARELSGRDAALL